MTAPEHLMERFARQPPWSFRRLPFEARSLLFNGPEIHGSVSFETPSDSTAADREVLTLSVGTKAELAQLRSGLRDAVYILEFGRDFDGELFDAQFGVCTSMGPVRDLHWLPLAWTEVAERWLIFRRFAPLWANKTLHDALIELLRVIVFVMRLIFAAPLVPDFAFLDTLLKERPFFELHGMGRPPSYGWAC